MTPVAFQPTEGGRKEREGSGVEWSGVEWSVVE
jgi:hypothetical protein